MIIGVTGNIGSGKSMVVEYLRELGAACIDADKVGHEVLLPGGGAYAAVVERFGQEYLDEQGYIDRRRLGAYVFSDPSGERARLLNQLTHPQILAEIQQRINTFRSQNYAIIILEAALLMDSALSGLIDRLWVVQCSPELAAARAAERDSCSAEQIIQRRRAQRDQAELVAMADVVIHNDGSLEELRQQTEKEYRQALMDAAAKV